MEGKGRMGIADLAAIVGSLGFGLFLVFAMQRRPSSDVLTQMNQRSLTRRNAWRISQSCHEAGR